MFCPKCNARIGLYKCKISIYGNITQGMSCYMCGYWISEDVTSVINYTIIDDSNGIVPSGLGR
ncbi:MAG: hypothetical protein FD174_1675 [Geobacteraceae bacterium]|nr:MAG: hypothetical protein FD174_1675 [Geobacteraceae bacterium]